MGRRSKSEKLKRQLQKLGQKIQELEEKEIGSSRSRSPRDRHHGRSPRDRRRTRSPRDRHRSPRDRCRTVSPGDRCHTPSPTTSRRSSRDRGRTRSPTPSRSQDIHVDMEQNTPVAAEPLPQHDVQVEVEQIPNDIDIDILAAMGTVEEETISGPPAHSEIAQRWTPILTKGLKKEDKALLLKQYVPFNNIPAMVPPKLNPELSAAVSEPVKKRDIIIEFRQKNIAAALAAIGCGLECFLTKGNKVDGIKNFNDAARILCELIHNETQSRRTLIQNVINKEMKESLQGSPDEFLFGAGLTERIKVTKAVQKSAQDLSKTITNKQNIAPPNQKSLNSRAPPQPGYKRSGFNRTKSEQRGGGGRKVPYNTKKTQRQPPQQRERNHIRRK